MIDIIDLTDEFEDDEYYFGRIAALELREIKDLLPLSFFGVKRREAGNIYVFVLRYKAYPLFAIIDEQTSKVRITKAIPDMEGFVPIDEATEDERVFPHIDYQYIIYKAMLVIASEKYLWVPIMGVCEECRDIVGLPRDSFAEHAREVLYNPRSTNGDQARRITTSQN